MPVCSELGGVGTAVGAEGHGGDKDNAGSTIGSPVGLSRHGGDGDRRGDTHPPCPGRPDQPREPSVQRARGHSSQQSSVVTHTHRHTSVFPGGTAAGCMELSIQSRIPGRAQPVCVHGNTRAELVHTHRYLLSCTEPLCTAVPASNTHTRSCAHAAGAHQHTYATQTLTHVQSVPMHTCPQARDLLTRRACAHQRAH